VTVGQVNGKLLLTARTKQNEAQAAGSVFATSQAFHQRTRIAVKGTDLLFFNLHRE
jgi:hypothetical protein